ncbi:MAG: hypothetical protein ACXVHT_05770 [Methanobacterium sp.]
MVKRILQKALKKKVVHAFHVIFEIFIKIKKAMGQSAHTIKASAVKAKAAAQGVTANPLTNPAVHVATKSIATAGTAITSTTATTAVVSVVVSAVVLTGGAAIYEYQTNPDFNKATSESVKPLTNLINEPQAPIQQILQSPSTLTSSQNTTTTQTTGSTSENTLTIGVGTGETNTGSNALSIGLGTLTTNNQQSTTTSTPQTVTQDNPNDHSAIAPSIDFEIPG